MRRTLNTKRWTILFLPCPIDEDMNRGVADELENILRSSFPIKTTKSDVTHLLHALMMKQSNGNKWVVHFRAPIDNVLVVEHKYRHSLSITVRNSYKRKEQQNPKGHTNTHPKITPSHFLSKQTFSLSVFSIRVFLINTIPVCSISFQRFSCRFE